MILFSPAKINIGLQIVERRIDGFHNLQSVMFPVGLCDILEIRETQEGEFVRGEPARHGIRFGQSGIALESRDKVILDRSNLCVRAWEAFSAETSLPPVEIHLHKQIPVGAGLGGGSSNASVVLRGLNMLTNQALPEEKLFDLAARLGSDCSFFLQDQPMMMEGRGEILSPVSLEMDAYCLVLLNPGISISTAEAYSGIKPAVPETHLRELVSRPVDQWKGLVTNDFERSVFEKYPELELLKHDLYQAGAIYASLSGSGSSLYGIFRQSPDLPEKLDEYVVWRGRAVEAPGIT